MSEIVIISNYILPLLVVAMLKNKSTILHTLHYLRDLLYLDISFSQQLPHSSHSEMWRHGIRKAVEHMAHLKYAQTYMF